MKKKHRARAAARKLIKMDDRVRKAMKPIRHRPEIEAIGFVSDIADQAPMRIISGAVIAAGLIAGNGRLSRTGARMLLAHELATLAKNAIKNRIDRSRPRSASGKDGHRPSPGRKTAKEETSFPSGHSAGAMAVASALAAEYPQYRTPAIGAAIAAGAAQVPRCAHYPTDVVAGFAIGAGANGVAGLLIDVMEAFLRERR